MSRPARRRPGTRPSTPWVRNIGAALDADPTLGGLTFGMTTARPGIDTEAVIDAPAIKTGTIDVIVEYETATPLG